ncbi:synapse-associated protein 1 [Caerostris extrusa]|uniref:Synapse-associated protein 1 n=1 Tax=Caerostris extrusa TaxID=172846 RepID=A0AAV4TYK1_CAEEX|nr:synapse-associated protein 1 [Caerostris extrusa]
MDLLWKVSSKAKEMLSHKDDVSGNPEDNKAETSASFAAGLGNEKPSSSLSLETQQGNSDRDASSESEGIDSEHSAASPVSKELNLDGSEDAERSSIKMGISAEILKMLLTRQWNQLSHLGVFYMALLIKLVALLLKLLNNECPPPWAGTEDEEYVKEQILSLSADKRNFLRNPPTGVMFDFSFDSMYPVAEKMLKEDPALEKMRFEIVPKIINEETFWKNYFYRVQLVKNSSKLNKSCTAENWQCVLSIHIKISFLGKGRKSDLIEFATEIGGTIPPETFIVDIKKIITSNKNYDKEFIKKDFERIIQKRIKKEENENQRQIEIEEQEKQRQIVIEEREKQRQIVIKEREKQSQVEIAEWEKQRAFELEKLKLQNENKVMFQMPTEYKTIADHDVGPDSDATDSPNHEFVSDAFQSSQVSEEDIKHGMKMLGVTEKNTKDDDWEQEMQQELQEYEVVAEGNDDDPDWENEIEQMLDDKVKYAV